jgi:hypothetical protein
MDKHMEGITFGRVTLRRQADRRQRSVLAPGSVERRGAKAPALVPSPDEEAAREAAASDQRTAAAEHRAH